MINPFNIGDTKSYRHTVVEADLAAFHGQVVHPFYGTFALARDAEWSSRLFVLEMKEQNEEGIGTFVNLKHVSPALQGDEVCFTASLKEVNGNSVICTISAHVGDRLIATGETGQQVLEKSRIDKIKKNLG